MSQSVYYLNLVLFKLSHYALEFKHEIYLTFQGEKAYSCSQCGTRFTYRNGLIKHTKLNRCPKKIITPEGETIIKKRSRTFGTNAGKTKVEQVNNNKTNDSIAVPTSSVFSSLRSPSLPHHPLAQSPPSSSNENLSSLIEPPPETSIATTATTAATTAELPNNNATLFVQDQQIQLHANGDTYGLTVLEDGSLVATPQHKPTSTLGSTKVRSVQANLSPNVIAALSAATGLPANEIYSWAAALPAGSTVKVTHHFEGGAPAGGPSSTPSGPASNTPMPVSANAKTAMTSIRQTSPTVTTSRVQLQADRLMDHVLRQQRQQLTMEMANTCHDSLISACVGLPSYQESFAVDPNEILSRERGGPKNQLLPSPPITIKEEPLTPMFTNEDDLNNNSMEEDSLSTMISGDFNSSCNNISGSHNSIGNPFNYHPDDPGRSRTMPDNHHLHQPGLSRPSVINMANSRLLTSHVITSSEASATNTYLTDHSSTTSSLMMPSPSAMSTSSSISSSPCNSRGTVQSNHHHHPQNPDFDLDEIPVNFLDDMDLCGFNLNDQDFSSMKSIVEQTFKDGRDVLDIISAV